jgi:hypothetical protein
MSSTPNRRMAHRVVGHRHAGQSLDASVVRERTPDARRTRAACSAGAQGRRPLSFASLLGRTFASGLHYSCLVAKGGAKRGPRYRWIAGCPWDNPRKERGHFRHGVIGWRCVPCDSGQSGLSGTARPTASSTAILYYGVPGPGVADAGRAMGGTRRGGRGVCGRGKRAAGYPSEADLCLKTRGERNSASGRMREKPSCST